jgi:hypothetical protein
MGVDAYRLKKILKSKYISGYQNICFVTIFIFTHRNKNVSASEMLVNKLLARVLQKEVKIKQSYYYHGDSVFFLGSTDRFYFLC